MKTLSIEKMKNLGLGCRFSQMLLHTFRKLYFLRTLVVLVITLVFTISCQEMTEEEKLKQRIEPDMENFYNNKIWFKDSKKNLVLLNRNNINEAFNIISFDESNSSNILTFGEFEFRVFEDEEKEDKIYSLNGTSKDGVVNTSLILSQTDDGDFEVMFGCTCTSKDCAHNWGCNVVETGPCQCSICDGNCEKKSSRSDQ